MQAPDRPVPGPLNRLVAICLGLLCLAIPSGSALAQVEGPAAAMGGTISGLIVDADHGAPLAGARVFLVPVESAIVAEHHHNGSPGFRYSHTVETEETGEYRFEGIPPGRYRVHVERPGYRSGQVDVDLAMGPARLTMGMAVEPIALPQLLVSSDAAQPYPRTLSPVADRLGARKAAVVQRQAGYLETDVRTLTAGQVTESVTAGEADLFRALQRLPGVGRRDDYTAVLWTRGAPWVQTRVYFDGLPLYNPTHAGSLFSSISPNGVGAVTYQPGVRSAEWGEGAAGILDLRSRSGRAHQAVGGSADLSLVSAQLALDGDVYDGRARWMVAGRRTHVDVLTDAWAIIDPGNGLHIPYDFADVTARVDLQLGPLGIEASGLNERDRLRGDIPGLLVGNTGRWGNRLGQVTLRLPVGPVELSAQTGGTRFATIVNETFRDPGATSGDEVTLPTLESGIDHDRSGVRLTSRPGSGGGLRWALGYEEVDERIRYDGPFSLLAEGIPGLVRDSLGRTPFTLTGRRAYSAAWGQARVRILQDLIVEVGLRVETGDSVRNGGDWLVRPRSSARSSPDVDPDTLPMLQRLASPRFSARWTPTPRLGISAGWGRSYQYTQAIGAAAGPLGPQLHLGHLWVLAGRGYPALRADIATAGAELWLGGDWLAGLNAYYRESTGITEPDPTPGQILPDRPHVEADATAYGMELSARRLVGRWTASVGYALAKAETRYDSLRYSASADVRHSIDATGAYHLNDLLRLGAAFSMASGIPFTRVIIDPQALPRLDDPAAQRTPIYASLDLLLDYTGELAGLNVGAYVQLLNALGRRNRVTYAGSIDRCATAASAPDGCVYGPVIEDRFKSGLPRLPLVGLRIAF
jgi:hypothetical protein